MRKRLLSALLCVTILATVIPFHVIADNEVSTDDPAAALLAMAQAAPMISEEESWYDSMKSEAELAEDENSMVNATTASYPTNYPNTWVNTGDQAIDIAQVGASQIGYTETKENHTKYNAWYYGSDTTVSWCATFISWCANQAKVPTNIVRPTALAGGYSLSNMQSNSFGAPAYAFGAQTPKPGDIAYITSSGNTSDHVGLVIAVDSNYVYTAEGNASDTVGERRYTIRSGYQAYGGSSVSSSIHIIFFARPKYTTTATPTPTPSQTPTPTPSPSPSLNPTPTPSPEPDPIEREPIDAFEDVYKDDYYADPVIWAVENGITSGTTETTFSPNDGCSRGQAVTFLWRVAGCPEPKGQTCCFEDVSSDMYYYKAVLWAVENGITAGTSDTTFNPEDGCTRGQIVTMMYRAVGEPYVYPYYAYINPFTDVPSDAYYYNAVLWAMQNQITSGTSDTTFSPDLVCTRGQIVTFLYRACN